MAQAKPPMTREDFIDLKETIKATLDSAGVGFVCYIWSEELDLGSGCNSSNADVGDGLVCIYRIAKAFGIDQDRMHEAMVEYAKKEP